MNKAKFTRNAFGIQVKKCCASCAHKQLNRTVSQRVCAKHNKEVRACEVCECWKMSDMLKSFCMSEGQIKRREYQLYLLKIRERESEIDVVSKGNLFCINPINWRTDTVSAPFINYGRKKNDTLIAQLDPESRLLLISGLTNDKPMAVIGKPGNYHHMELKFFYPYIRQNMADRAAAFLAKKKE